MKIRCKDQQDASSIPFQNELVLYMQTNVSVWMYINTHQTIAASILIPCALILLGLDSRTTSGMKALIACRSVSKMLLIFAFHTLWITDPRVNVSFAWHKNHEIWEHRCSDSWCTDSSNLTLMLVQKMCHSFCSLLASQSVPASLPFMFHHLISPR